MDVTCDICTAGIVYPIYFLLKPCSHTACVKCFHEMVPAKIFLRCPCSGCCESITSSTLLEITSTECNNSRISSKWSSSSSSSSSYQPPSLDSTNVTSSDADASNSSSSSSNNSPKAGKLHSFENIRAIQEVLHFEPDEQMDPFRHWAIKKPELYTGFMYVAYRFSDDEVSVSNLVILASTISALIVYNSSFSFSKIGNFLQIEFQGGRFECIYGRQFKRRDGQDLRKNPSSSSLSKRFFFQYEGRNAVFCKTVK